MLFVSPLYKYYFNLLLNDFKNKMLYEINTRVWLKQFDSQKLIDVPRTYWENLKNKGFEYIWLMGIWQTVPLATKKYCFVDGLINEYNNALPNWKEEDVIGSPYAIDRYEVNPQIASKEEIIRLKKLFNNMGLKLILDFIPNHFNAETTLLKEHPEIFLKVNKELHDKDNKTFFMESYGTNYYAHGKDPYFEAWQDTIQINYFTSEARDYMTNVLLELTNLCDGVRCDMAMLMLNSVFSNTWQEVKSVMNYDSPKNEFWSSAITQVKDKRKDFLFIAEAYWDLEYQLQTLGFDYTYDKRLYDRLTEGNVKSISEHLKADKDYQLKSVRFIENHDEKRSASVFGKRTKAAAVIMSTLLGMKLYYDGQFVGKKIKLPVQLGREPKEEINIELQNFYDKLLSITKDKVFKKDEFELLTPIQAWNDNDTHKNLLAWLRYYEERHRLVVVNYSDITSVCRVKFNPLPDGLPSEEIALDDLLNNKKYIRSVDEILTQGLYIQLGPFESHIFSF